MVPLLILYVFVFSKKESSLSNYYNNLYDILYKLPFTRKTISEIRHRLYKTNLWDERLLRYKAVTKYLLSLAVFIILTLLSIVYFYTNLFVMAALIFFSYQIKNLVLDWSIGDDTHLLRGLLNYADDLMQEFSFSSNVFASMKAAMEQNTNYTTVKYIEQIIENIDDEEKMDDYIIDCHNQFLRLFAITCFLTNEHGDTYDSNGISNFIKNIENIKTLINLELYKRTELKYWIKGLPFQCTIPLLLFVPYESWVSSVFTMVSGFYSTASAFLLKLGITIVCLLCFFIIKSYEKTESDPIIYRRASWEMRLLNFKSLAKFIKFVMPKDNSPRAYKYRDLISKSGMLTKIEFIYLRKLVFGVGAFILTLLIIVSINKINYNNILKNNTTNFKSDLITASGKQVESTDIENEILGSLNSDDPKENKDTATKLLMQKGIVDEQTLNKISQKIADKKVSLINQTEQWWQVILAIVLGVAATFIPEFFIRIRINARKISMEEEIILFETIILILIAHNNCTTELLIDNMAKFSVIFKDYMELIAKRFQKLEYEEIAEMLIEINYKEFSSLIKNIMKAEDIGIKEAFINLSSNRATSLDKRKSEYEKLIDSRIAKSRLIAKIPAGLFLIGYVLVPIMSIAFMKLIDMRDQMDSVK